MGISWYKPYDVSWKGKTDLYVDEDIRVKTSLEQDLDGNFGKALGSIKVYENDPKHYSGGSDKDYKYDKEGLDIVASELILDSFAAEGIGSAATTQAILLTDDHLTSGLAGAEALGTNTLAETTIDIDVKDESVHLGGFSASGADGVGGGDTGGGDDYFYSGGHSYF
ncbi:MAG: hypothetical protein AAF661_09850 [Pseudomonadota bacterium]